MKVVVQNKRAYYDYQIFEALEAGIVLAGSEVKSIKMGRVSINESFARFRGGELFLFNAHIAPYPAGVKAGYDPRALRKLLLKRQEIDRLVGRMKEGLTLLPLKVYIKYGIIKVEIAVARPKKKYDKREQLKKKMITREVEKTLGEWHL
ncbi:SsrA-binding protein [bacterium CG1_02_42_9]|nr:MAG: SsrA-binding protein [bacterium CG1_02_42_9]